MEKYLKIEEEVQEPDIIIDNPRTICIDCIFFYYLSKEIKLSKIYRINFSKSQGGEIRFLLQPTRVDLIDYRWNYRMGDLVRERCELEHALSWLSTLGGAFSALGDYYASFAQVAAKISISQLKLALKLQDPMVVSRCRLYFSLSLIQQKRFKLAKFIIKSEYENAKKSVVLDTRLMKMCRGIWAKLQYEYKLQIR